MGYARSQYYTITPESIRREQERLYSKARHDEAQALKHAKQEIARNFLMEGLSAEVIAKCTDLTPEEIESLR